MQLAVFLCCAQSMNPSVIASQGTYNETASFSLEWTLGETFIETTPVRALILTEGFHQPTIPFKDVWSVSSPFFDHNGVEGNPNVQFSIEVYPNPFQSEISVEIDGELDQDYKVTLLSTNGMIVRESRILSGTGVTNIDGLELPPATYLVKVQGVSDAKLCVREVIKFN